MSRTFIEAISHRRSHYYLENISPVATTHIIDTIDEILSIVPSPFNVQSARLVVLFDQQHIALWDIVEHELESRIPSDIFNKTRQKLHRSFRSGFGTILIYEDEAALNQLRINYPDYAENVERWLIDKSWRLIAQMPFGLPKDSPAPHIQKIPIHQRRLVFGFAE